MNAVLEALTNLGFDWRVALANLFNFALIFFVLKHFFFGTIQKTLADRKSKIEKGEADAHNAALLLQNSEAEKEKILTEASLKASTTISEAEGKALASAAKVAEEAQMQADKIISIAEQKQAELSKQNQRDLEKQIPALAAKMVEKILSEKMTTEENEKFISAVIAK